MKTTPEIKSELARLPYFTLSTVRQLTDTSAQSTRMLLFRWEKTGEAMRIMRGLYMIREFWLSHKDGDKMIPLLSSVIDPQSYLTSSWVLQKYGVMTEAVYEITAVTPRHAKVVNNKLGRFVYAHVSNNLVNNFTEIDCWGILAHQATPAKALFDYLNLASDARMYLQLDYDLAEDLRLNLSEWSSGWRDEFGRIVGESGVAKMIKANENLKRYVWRS